MDKISNFNELSTIEYYKQHGYKIICNNNSYFREKNKKVRMYDENHVIKKAGNNLMYLNELKELNINGINQPLNIGYNDQENIYYIINKYLSNAQSLLNISNSNINIKDIINIIDKVLIIIEKCHNQDFYIIDINDLNILIDSNLNPYLYDFDTSCFIKNNQLIASNTKIEAYLKDEYIKYVLHKYYNLTNEYQYSIDFFKDKFIFVDKLEVISLLIELLLIRLNISFNNYDYLENKEIIKKIGLSRNLENNLIKLVDGIPLSKDNYFHEDLQELASSRFIRKRKFR